MIFDRYFKHNSFFGLSCVSKAENAKEHRGCSVKAVGLLLSLFVFLLFVLLESFLVQSTDSFLHISFPEHRPVHTIHWPSRLWISSFSVCVCVCVCVCGVCVCVCVCVPLVFQSVSKSIRLSVFLLSALCLCSLLSKYWYYISVILFSSHLRVLDGTWLVYVCAWPLTASNKRRDYFTICNQVQGVLASNYASLHQHLPFLDKQAKYVSFSRLYSCGLLI